MLIKNGRVFTRDFCFLERDIVISDGRIQHLFTKGEIPYAMKQNIISSDDIKECFDAGGKWILPGLIDIHVHGAMGADTNDGTPEAFSTIARYQLQSGITTFVPTTMTLPADRIRRVVQTVGQYVKTQKRDESRMAGVHLEGPFIASSRAGAQNPAYVIPPDSHVLGELLKQNPGVIKKITMAPELPGAMAMIHAFQDQVGISIGHTEADYETAKTAFSQGARFLTHMFNAMPGIHHRMPGPILAAMETPYAMAELISDGIHVHPAMIRLAFEIMGPERIILVSDGCRATGMPDGIYELGGQCIKKQNHAAYLIDGTLAAATTTLYDGMIHAIRFGIRPEDAIRAASYNPAKALGIVEQEGSIEVGKAAKLLLVDPERNYALCKVWNL